jgi:hemolysin III
MPETHPPLRAEHLADRAVLTIGLVLSLIGAGWLLALMTAQQDGFRGWSGAVYGTALVLMFSCATVYHWLPDDRPRSFMRILDHCAIFVLIAGTYTPFTLPNVSAPWALITLLLMWGMVGVGIIYKFLWIGRRDRASVFLYLAMGWSAVAVFQPLAAAVSGTVLRLIVAGGVLYSIGAFVYVWKGMPFRLAIWHSFVIAGSSVHYFAVTNYLRA